MMAEGGEDVVPNVNADLLRSIEDKLNGCCLPAGIPSIYRVPPSVRVGHESAYDPQIISIGPFHRGKKALQAMEPLKWSYLKDLICRSPRENKLEKYIDDIRTLEPLIRSCYSEHVELDSKEFVEMMVVDGCFIVEFLIKWRINVEDERIVSPDWNLPLLKNDLLLLENQIPFLVLRVLFHLSSVPALEVNPSLLELAAAFISSIHQDHLRGIYGCLLKDETSPEHLLHLAHRPYQLAMMKPMAATNGSSTGIDIEPNGGREGNKPIRVIETATKLKKAGVEFIKKTKASCFLDVTFNGGMMQIPELFIEQETSSWFRNLLAVEQSSSHDLVPFDQKLFTSYASLLNNLVHTPADVAVLKESGIVESYLSGDDVTRIFNQLSKGGYLNYDNHYLRHLVKDVNTYCEGHRHRWWAELMEVYFRSPWTTTSFIAATILLILTFLQTFFAVYSVYSQRS